MKEKNTKDCQGEVNRNREHRLKSLLYFSGKYDILMENRDLIVYCQERKTPAMQTLLRIMIELKNSRKR